jgi:signal transduction histidine kinase
VNERLALLVDRREAELAANYRQITQLERRHAAAEERQRIIQDMHDGVGSRLVSALALVQCGEVSQQELAGLLQESLDEMRLVIDSMSPEEPDLLPALWNFRHRMEPRLKRIGIELIWRAENMPEKLDLGPHSGLHVLRILQETITNVLKHAQASTVRVFMRHTAEHFEIRVEDDGIGLDEGKATRGHGMMSMRNRAKKIGAAFHVDNTGRGCGISLVVPLAAVSSA